jgi:predicted metal-dependent peptidase
VVKMLIDEKEKGGDKEGDEPGEGGQRGKGKGRGKPMDTHLSPKKQGKGEGTGEGGDVDGSGMTPAELKKQLNDAVNQGAIVRNKMRGVGGGGNALGGFQERNTDWRTPLRRFVSETCEGYDNSTFSPRNRLYVPHDIVMPSHFSEMVGELIVACDTSGSMDGLYPTVFGEIANICKTVTPEKVRVIWWGDHIEGEQVFVPKDYDRIKDLMSPKGGGGTTVSCVAKHVEKMKYKPRATIMLTDGYVESQYECVSGPLLWGIVDNEAWVPLKGKVLHISSLNETR